MLERSDVRLEVLITIMDFSLVDSLNNLFKKNSVPISLFSHGYGSAESEIYDILGYGGPKKVVSLSILTEKMSRYIMEQINSKIDISKPGTGIAFTISLSSVSKSLLMTCSQADENSQIGSENMDKMPTENYHLIITIANNGYFEEVMETANAAGATGGTLVHARGLGSKEAIKYLGITIEPEKDLILILASEDKKNIIMQKITQKVGLNTPGMGICFSLPVNDTMGFGTGVDIRDL